VAGESAESPLLVSRKDTKCLRSCRGVTVGKQSAPVCASLRMKIESPQPSCRQSARNVSATLPARERDTPVCSGWRLIHESRQRTADADILSALLFTVGDPVRRADLLEASGRTPPRLPAAFDALVAKPPPWPEDSGRQRLADPVDDGSASSESESPGDSKPLAARHGRAKANRVLDMRRSRKCVGLGWAQWLERCG